MRTSCQYLALIFLGRFCIAIEVEGEADGSSFLEASSAAQQAAFALQTAEKAAKVAEQVAHAAQEVAHAAQAAADAEKAAQELMSVSATGKVKAEKLVEAQAKTKVEAEAQSNSTSASQAESKKKSQAKKEKKDAENKKKKKKNKAKDKKAEDAKKEEADKEEKVQAQKAKEKAEDLHKEEEAKKAQQASKQKAEQEAIQKAGQEAQQKAKEEANKTAMQLLARSTAEGQLQELLDAIQKNLGRFRSESESITAPDDSLKQRAKPGLFKEDKTSTAESQANQHSSLPRYVRRHQAARPGPALLAKNDSKNEESLSRRIPMNLLFTYKTNLLSTKEADIESNTEALILRKNVKHTLKTFLNQVEAKNVHFWDDTDCKEGIMRLSSSVILDASKLVEDFAQEKNGRVRADLCRLVMLHEYGGFYLDNDILPVVDLLKYILPNTTFATVLAEDESSYTQSFIAAVPQHPVIANNLRAFQAWYGKLKKLDGPKQVLLRQQTMAAGDIGSSLMKEAYEAWSGWAYEEPRVLHKDSSHISQFFQERHISSLDSSYHINALAHGESGGSCDMVVVDRQSKSPIFLSRVYDAQSALPCREEIFQMLTDSGSTV
mmetsp:Transcript_69537/g.122979  ORF Transcript_69537/g.122979 Transcript_69537/m.122979 type:complete len:605 (-) Transcript_69537:41-1855(-)